MLKFISFFLIIMSSLTTTCFGSAMMLVPNTRLSPSDIYTVIATPTEANLSYKLEIYEQENKPAVMTAIRPLDNSIVDIMIKDVDNDGEEELVVLMQDEYSEPRKLHFDVFEFANNQLSWVENFPLSNNLLALFATKENKY